MKSINEVRLTDMQRIVLTSAAQRDDEVLVCPDRIKGGAAHKLASVLIEKGLAREIRSKPEMPVWRRDTNGRPISLAVTKRGLAVVRLAEESTGTTSAVVAGEGDNSGIGVAGRKPGSMRPGSKIATVIALLGREAGARLEELTAATGWLPHTTRAALTGLRKRGFALAREPRTEGGSVYRITQTPGQAQT